MNLDFTPEEEAFRDDVRGFIDRNFPKHLQMTNPDPEMTREKALAWHKILGPKGWSTPSWPREYGGPGWSAVQQYIWREENAKADTTPLLPFGVDMVGPVIYTFGTDAQKKRFLPGIRLGDDWWCQGYSEPNAGSDLANLSTRAVRHGDHYIVSGQKTWTSHAQFADWGFFLVRTNGDAAKPQDSISFLLINMKSPGVTVRPIKLMDESYEVNDVYLDDVKVPVENRIGDEHRGWTYAKFLLSHERAGIGGVARSHRALMHLRQIARHELADNGRPFIACEHFQRKLSELEINLESVRYIELMALANHRSDQTSGAQASMMKIAGTEIQQRITELALEVVGHHAAPNPRAFASHAPGDDCEDRQASLAAAQYFNQRKASIYGGSNEIQRNIIAKITLGL